MTKHTDPFIALDGLLAETAPPPEAPLVKQRKPRKPKATSAEPVVELADLIPLETFTNPFDFINATLKRSALWEATTERHITYEHETNYTRVEMLFLPDVQAITPSQSGQVRWGIYAGDLKNLQAWVDGVKITKVVDAG